MRNRHWILFAAFVGLVVAACSDESAGGNSFSAGGSGGSGGIVLTCDDLLAPPLDCGKSCNSNSDCTASFCANGECVANCTGDQGCGENETCNSRGSCVRNSTGGVGGTGGVGVCRDIDVTPTRSIPNVMFLVDQSGSMRWTLTSNSRPSDELTKDRWEEAHEAITQIVDDAGSSVRFGLTTYTSRDGDNNPPCPRLPIQVPFGNPDGQIGNPAVYPPNYTSNDGGDTPTGDSVRELTSLIVNNPPPADGPTVIVLVTDGAPDSCEYPNPSNSFERQSAQDEVWQAVEAAHDPQGPGIDTFVLWVGLLTDDDIQDHLKEVANVGIGLPRLQGVPAPNNEDPENPAQGAPFWVGDEPSAIQSALNNIIYDSISCEILIDKPFNPATIQEACDDGTVTLNGNPLECGVDWQIRDEPPYNVFELLGGVEDPDSACGIFKIQPGAQLEAKFPCGTIVQ